MSALLEDVDKRLLNLIQRDFPLEARPYRALGERLGASEGEAIERIRALREKKYIRQVSAIFDTRTLGYRSSLVAMKFSAEKLNAGAAVVSEHPGVSHNYRRNHAYNLWFTVAVPPGGDLERTVDRLHELAGAEVTRMLPTLKLFKIGVTLDMTGEEPLTATDGTPRAPVSRFAKAPLTAKDVAAIRELQEDLLLMAEPFAPMAERLGVSVPALLEHARLMIENRWMRRFAAVLHHRRAGFRANGMGVWAVPEERAEEVGLQMASFRAVSHCYQRPVYPDWPYSIFTMVHGRTVEDCEKILRGISEATGVSDYAVLYSTREYKKVRLRYFSEEMDEWNRKHLPDQLVATRAAVAL